MSIENSRSRDDLTPAQVLLGDVMGAVMAANNDDPRLDFSREQLQLLSGRSETFLVRLGSAEITQRVRTAIMQAISKGNLQRQTEEIPDNPILGIFQPSNGDAINLLISQGKTRLDLSIGVLDQMPPVPI